VRIIIKCPESDSPPKGRIHLRGLSFRKSSNLLQFGGGPYILANCPRLINGEPATHNGADKTGKPTMPQG
jgi:hypothetical protein